MYNKGLQLVNERWKVLIDLSINKTVMYKKGLPLVNER